MRVVLALLFIVTVALGEKTLKIASYNVENLFDLQRSGHEYQEYIPNTRANWNARTYKRKLQNISRVIKDIDADIIALQEIESLQALKDLRYILKQKGLYYQYYKIANRKNTTIKVAILSKIPFQYTQEVMVTSSYKYRNILEAKFTLNGSDLYLFANHWKAKSGPESQRIISAKALRRRLKEIGYDKNIILLGDFNSDYEEYIKFKRKRRHNDTGGKTGINHVIGTIEGRNSFYNLWYDTQKDNRWTYIFRGKKEALDNIIISKSLNEKNSIHYKHSSISSFKPAYLLKGKRIYRWSTTWKKPRRHKGKGYSDHLAVTAEFVIQ